MCNVICLGGLLVAALFAIVVYGPLGLDSSVRVPWVDYVFWGIIALGALPAAAQLTRCHIQAFRSWRRRRVSSGSLGRV